jgi:hypothetical protein
VLRKRIKEFGSDPAQAYLGHGQMKPEQFELERLRREANKLKPERDILKTAAVRHTMPAGRSRYSAAASSVARGVEVMRDPDAEFGALFTRADTFQRSWHVDRRQRPGGQKHETAIATGPCW